MELVLVGTVASALFLSVAVWSWMHYRERAALYRTEILKKLVDAPPEAAARIVELMREQDRDVKGRRRDWQKLAGFGLVVVGVGAIAVLRSYGPIYDYGVVFPPGLVVLTGVMFLIAAYRFGPKN